MFKVNNSWPKTTASQGTQFFAQCMRSFLDKSSFEGFRAYSLDTIGRLREAVSLIRDVKAGRVSEQALKPLIDEIIWSLQSDRAAQAAHKDGCDQFVSVINDKSSSKTLIMLACEVLISRLENGYREQLINRVIASINECQKKEILTSTGFLVSHLINEGHSREYLIWRIDERFFSKDMLKVGAAVVRRFLASISEDSRDWVVVRKVNPTVAALLKAFESWELKKLDEFPDHAQKVLAGWASPASGSRFVSRRITSSDPFKAADQFDVHLEEVKSLRLIAPDPMHIEWSKESYVYTPRANEGHELEEAESTILGTPKSKIIAGRRLQQSQNLAVRVFKNFDVTSKDRITRALATGSLAADSLQDDIVLTSLWASIEVLLGDPPEQGARIVHFVSSLAPCVCIRYHRRTFVAIHDYLKVQHRSKFQTIVRSVDPDISTDDHTNFAKIISIPEFEQKRSEILTLCKDDPLALFRVYRLWEQYKSPKETLKTITQHFERVKWQINRIYRVRNSLVHAGRSPSYTDTLCLNLLEYLRAAIINLARVSGRSTTPVNVDRTIAEINLEWGGLISKLGNAGNADYDEGLTRAVFAAL